MRGPKEAQLASGRGLRPSGRRRLAVVTAAVLAALLSGCASATSAPASSGASSRTTTRDRVTTTLASRGAAEAVLTLTRDVPVEDEALLAPSSAVEPDAPDWLICRDSYASESLLLSRHWVWVSRGASPNVPLFSVEMDTYKSPAATAEAMGELRHAMASCPDTFVDYPGGEPIKWAFAKAPGGSWPDARGVERLVVAASVVARSGSDARPVDDLNVYLRKGRYLCWLNFYADSSPNALVPIDESTTVESVVRLFADKLATLGGA